MITIERLSGESYILDEVVKVLEFEIDSPEPDTETTVMEGMDGYLDYGTRYEGRTMRLILAMITDPEDFHVKRRKIFRIFDSKEYFYLIDDKEPDRRWRVKVADSFNMPRNTPKLSLFTVELQSNFPYAESIQSTLEGEPDQYTFQESTFNVQNKGDVKIDPRSVLTPLRIIFQGESENLEIFNADTGDVWTFEGTTTINDQLVLDGVRYTLNDQSIFNQTNAGVITLKPGSNSFFLTGITGDYEIKFDFRHYTL